MFDSASFVDLPAFKVAHVQDIQNATGVTVFVAPDGAACSVDVRGGAPATRESDLLKPENMVQKIHAVVLSGGSAFGLEAACGVMDALAQEDIGFELAGLRVPIVVGASLFDLPVGSFSYPDKGMGYKATMTALESNAHDLEQGNFGAGTGATVGKMGLPQMAMKSGFGWCGFKQGDVVVVSCAAVNACGNVMDESSEWIAGTQVDGVVLDPLQAAAIAMAQMKNTQENSQQLSSNTTLGVVLTNANLDKAGCLKVSQICQDAYARAIKPVHTTNDGDAIYTMASGDVNADIDMISIMATQAMECAIRSAVMSADAAYGLPSYKSINEKKHSNTKDNVNSKIAAKNTSSSKTDPYIRCANEDDDGYDPYSDRPADHEPLFEEDPWR